MFWVMMSRTEVRSCARSSASRLSGLSRLSRGKGGEGGEQAKQGEAEQDGGAAEGVASRLSRARLSRMAGLRRVWRAG